MGLSQALSEFLTNSDYNDMTKETLLEQFFRVRDRTSNNGSFSLGSHVMQFGQLSIDLEPVSDYIGTPAVLPRINSAAAGPVGQAHRVPQRDADLLHLQIRVGAFGLMPNFARRM